MNTIRTKGIVLFLISALAISESRSQNIGVNASGAAANASAMLDVDVSALGTKKGLLIPRVTAAEKTALNPLPAAAQGLIVYQTDGTQGFYYNTSITTVPAWSYLMPSSGGWSLLGNAGTSAATNFLGTTDAIDMVIRTNNVERMRVSSAGNFGIGTAPITTNHIIGSSTQTFGSLFGSQGILYSATSTNPTNNNNHTGAQFRGFAASGSRVRNLWGLEGDAFMGASIAGGLNIGQVAGVYGTAGAISGIASTTVGEIYGVLGLPQLFDPLNSTNLAGVASGVLLFSGNPTATNVSLFKGICNAGDISSGTITNLYGINIPVLSKTAPATVTTAYGAYIDMPTAGTTNYGAYIGGTLGVGTNPITALDVNGAYSARFSTAAAAAAVVIPNNVSLFRLSAVGGSTANALSVTTPQDGQFLTIINEDGDAATFAGFTIPALSGSVAGVSSFVYSGAGTVWREISSMPTAAGGSGWGLTGNTGTTASTSAIGTAANNNFIGTTDAKDYVLVSNNLERMRISSGGNIGINTITPSATALVTINPTAAAIRNGIEMTLSGAASTAHGLSIATANANANGVTYTQSSAAAGSMWGTGATLSNTNIVSGYTAYRNGSGLSYGVYGINGTNAAYATNVNTWAAFLQGRTVISSESSPTSPVGTDLEVRNTTTGAGSPATVSMRQTTALVASGNIMTNLNFGDNNGTTPQAQIQVIRGAASGSAADVPTSMLFYTTPDASAALTERMRIAHTGFVGVGATNPLTSLDVNGAISARFSTAAAALAVVIPNNVSIFRLSLVAGSTANALSVTTPQDGQFLVIINEDGDPATFAGYTIPALAGVVAGVGTFVYSGTGAVWRQIASMPAAGGGGGWSLTGNAGTSAATNFIGTTDAIAFNIRVNNLRSGLIEQAGNGSTFFGYRAGRLTNAIRQCTAMGYDALAVNTSGNFNTAIGYQSLLVNTTGARNTALGGWALQANTTGVDNVAVGVNALYNATGTGNTSVGYQSMYFMGAGTYNTALGWGAFMNSSFSNCMVLGSDQFSFCTPTGNNMVWVGDNTVTSIRGQVAFGTYSDGRIKNDVKENVPGLDFIKELRPVSYNYDVDKQIALAGGKNEGTRPGKYDIEKIRFSGFIAQEVESAAKKIGYDFSGVDKPADGTGIYSLRYSEFVVPLVKAVQELDAENKELKNRLDKLSTDNLEIKAQLEKLVKMIEGKPEGTATGISE